MKQVKRYEFNSEWGGGEISESLDGDYVEYSDYIALKESSENISKREYFAAHAPFTMQDAQLWFEPMHDRLPTGAELMTTLKVLRYMYADAMISEEKGEK